MFFSFIYDHNYLKFDRDFYGDAIVSFSPSESKDKVRVGYAFDFTFDLKETETNESKLIFLTYLLILLLFILEIIVYLLNRPTYRNDRLF